MDVKMQLPADEVPAPDRAAVESAIGAGKAYMESHIPSQRSLLLLLGNQLHYLSASLWAVEFLVLVIAGFLAWHMRGTGASAGSLMLLLAPLTALVGIPEVVKSSTTGVLELEMSCRYSGASLLLARLFLIGAVNTAGAFLCCEIFRFSLNGDFWETLLCGLVPGNAVYFLSFLIFRLFRFQSKISVFACSLLSGLISYVLFGPVLILDTWNPMMQTGAWLITCVLLAAELGWELRRICLRKDVGLWNFA